MGISVADVVKMFSSHPGCENIGRSGFIVDEVPNVYFSGQTIYGIYDPTQPIDFSTRFTESDGYVRRYGSGAGRPVKQDLSVLPAISFIPDKDHAFKGALRSGGGDAPHLPSEGSCKILGIDPWEWSRGLNLADLDMLPELQLRVLWPLDLGFPVGTSPDVWRASLQSKNDTDGVWHSPVWIQQHPEDAPKPVQTPTQQTPPQQTTTTPPTATSPTQSSAQQPTQPTAKDDTTSIDLRSVVTETVTSVLAPVIQTTLPMLIEAAIAKLLSKSTPAAPAATPVAMPPAKPIKRGRPARKASK